MKAALLVICVAFAFGACSSKEQRAEHEYEALVASTDREYAATPERAYQAELRFSRYVEQSIERGGRFPDKAVLVWTYPRIALAAEYAGRKEEAARMYAFADDFRKQVYPGQPVDKTGRFKTLRDAVIFMDRNAGIGWLNNRSPNQPAPAQRP